MKLEKIGSAHIGVIENGKTLHNVVVIVPKDISYYDRNEKYAISGNGVYSKETLKYNGEPFISFEDLHELFSDHGSTYSKAKDGTDIDVLLYFDGCCGICYEQHLRTVFENKL